MTTNGGESKKRPCPQREQLTWLRVRVPGRRLAETRGHEYIGLGRCRKGKKVEKKEKRNWHYTLHTNQNEHVLYRKRGSGGREGEASDLPECEGGNCCVKEDVLSLFTGGQ